MPMRDDPTADEGFDAFVRARWTATARLAYALTLDHQKAEDLAQEAFTKLWFRWQKVYDESPEGYLRRIVTTTFLSGRRRRWTAEHPTDRPPETSTSCGTGRVDDRLALHQAMARLSPRQRAAVYLRFSEDMSEQAVAEMLGCSVGSVKQHTSRGLAALRASTEFNVAGQLAELAGKGSAS
jgi:RNA polymerase sigma-70 factor (sigma-E family)